jgi:hypothetical protein
MEKLVQPRQDRRDSKTELKNSISLIAGRAGFYTRFRYRRRVRLDIYRLHFHASFKEVKIECPNDFGPR